jgi:hypothetical protein
MTRVGCMPCINRGKDQIREIAIRFPEHVDRIAEWEALVSRAAKRGYSTYFHKFEESGNTEAEIFARNNVRQIVEWARTSRGGRQLNFFDQLIDEAMCSSSYGLCE